MQYQDQNKGSELIKSIITCPHCGFRSEEVIPLDYCLNFYTCRDCKAVLSPKNGDCCVFCTYGSVRCPFYA